MSDYFHRHLVDSDPLVSGALAGELDRQQHQIELIASENIVSQAVLDALGHPITNKTLEGYPGSRFHGGGQFMDIIEQAAIDRARKLFDCDYVNVQPHSGTQANQAVFFAALNPGDRVLSMNLAAGGHLSHGAPPNQSGRWFEAQHYGVDPETGLIDYDEVESMANSVRPALLIAGGSAYPREINFAHMEQIARSVNAMLLVDMAHIAGLVAAGVHPSPIPYADFVTCTTTKTLRGPRGGLILSRDLSRAKKLQSAIFPGVQGSLHSQIIAAKAVCLGEALQPEFQSYARQVVDNARALGKVLSSLGIKLVSGGTDSHMVLLDLSPQGLNGQQVQDALAMVNITSNKNPIPFDSAQPSQWAGLRLGVSAATTRGLREVDFSELAAIIAATIHGIGQNDLAQNDLEQIDAHRNRVRTLCDNFAIY
jgi:glycine hydroxymethyltransferase